jgi:uncharacterized membrane protein
VDILKVLVDTFFLVVNAFVVNQYKGHWLLIDALFVAITMNYKLKEELE